LKSPAKSLAGSAEGEQQGGQGEEGKENPGGVGEAFGTGGGPAFPGKLDEV